MVGTDDALARSEFRTHLCFGSDGDDPAGRHNDGVIRKRRVDRQHRQHPAGCDQEIGGFFRWHAAQNAQKEVWRQYIGEPDGAPAAARRLHPATARAKRRLARLGVLKFRLSL